MPLMPINSLQDLLTIRELKNQANPTYSAIKSLADGIALGIQKKQEEAKEKKDEEEQFNKSIDNYNKVNKTFSDKFDVAYNDGKINISPKNSDENIYKKELSDYRMQKLQTEREREERLAIKDKFMVTKSFGGTMNEEELKKLSGEAGIDLGTDLQSGRIEQYNEGDKVKYRVLSDQEFSKKASIIKDVKDAESGLNIVLGDIAQIERMFDFIPEGLKGPIEGRTKAPVASFFGQRDVKTYNDVVNAFTSNIARSVLLEKGVLTNQDVERAKGLLPKIEDTEEIKNKKIEEIRNLLKTRFDEFNRRQEAGMGDVKESKSSFSNLWN